VTDTYGAGSSILIDLPEELRLVQQTARELADRELAPQARERDKTGSFPRESMKKLADLGFMGCLIPEEYGGSGIGNLALSIILEEINRGCAATGVTLSVHNSLATSPLVRFGSEELKKKYLPRMASGELLGAYALTEPGAGSDAVSISTRVRKEKDKYVLNGRKAWITNAGEADVIVVYGTLDKAKRSKGICAFLVEKDFPGFQVGKKENKLGIRASNCTELIFENLEIPLENLVGEEGRGFVIAMNTLDGGRIGIAAQAMGIACASLDASVKYSQERIQFERPIAEFQAIQWKLANMAMEIDAARLLMYRAALLRDLGRPHTLEASMAKLFASEMANRAATDAVQVFGGWGYCEDFDVERYYRDAKITEIYEGTSEIQRLVIARQLMQK
jgi:butyryl-CoA dehydrogenase